MILKFNQYSNILHQNDSIGVKFFAKKYNVFIIYVILEVLKNKYQDKKKINKVPKLFRMLENMKAESDKETLEYIEDFFVDIT